MVMLDKEHSGAWRCPEFKCDGYSEYSPYCNGIADVHSKLCHTCGYGKSCKHCMNVNKCKDSEENIMKQEEKSEKNICQSGDAITCKNGNKRVKADIR